MKRAIKFMAAAVLMALLCGLAGLGPITAQSAILYVDGASGSDTSNCQNSAFPCQTIGHAISWAGEGDTILIGAGTYEENLHIAEMTLTLRGGYSSGEWLPVGGETIVDGGGSDRVFFIHGSNSVLEDLTITGGHRPQGEQCWGGGVWVTNGNVTIRSCMITGNFSGCSGGGIEVNGDWGPGHLTLVDSFVMENQSAGHAGGMTVYAAAADLTNTLIVNNMALSGTALAIYDSDVTIQNATISDNYPQGEKAILMWAPPTNPTSTLTVRNSIMYNNGLPNIQIEGECADCVNVSYSDIEGGWPGDGNIDRDPWFVDPASGDYHLQYWSPCIDAATADGAPGHDFEGDARPQNAGHDMGADEFAGTIPHGPRYVATDGSDEGPYLCLDPANPCQTIGHAIAVAADGDSILIAADTYFENLHIADKTLTLRGGYTISGEQWLPGGGETIVDGGGVDRVLLIEGNDSVLENLTITGGQTPEDECWGGGVFLWGGDVTIRSSIIRDNRAEGGWYDEPSGSWIECGSGGGIQVGCCTGHLTLEDSVLADNYAIDLGAGISVVGVDSPVGAASADLTNVLVMNNTAGGETAMDVNEANIAMQNCTVAGNHGGFTPVVSAHNNREDHIVSIRNSIVWGHPGGSVECGGGSCEVSYSDIEGGCPPGETGWTCDQVIAEDPQFVDPTSGDYHLLLGSPAIDAGDNSAVPPYVATDLEGNPRIADCTVDMGAFESIGQPNSSPPQVGPIAAPTEPVDIKDQPISVGAHFTDQDVGETHTAVWDWGDDNTSPGQVDQVGDSVAGTHTYTAAGVYTVRLTVQDALCSGESVFRYVVVYDPGGGIGFVTGGGWINSPEGAYAAEPSLTGKATFGFVSKYKKGASVPTGQTEFQFHVADLNFHSTSYQWLVVGGGRAQFKGTGTINGAGDYGFMLTAVDAELTPSQDVDLFRIKIWDKNGDDEVVYDNQPGDYDGAVLTTQIGGGNIVIHK